jgi:glycosyltransferase involved in cell wall biosynthesis
MVIYTQFIGLMIAKMKNKKVVEENSAFEIEQFRAFMDSLNNPVGIFNSDFKLVDVNKYGENLLGPKKKIIGRHITYYAPDLMENGRFEIYKNVLKTGRPVFIEEINPHPNLYDRKVAIQAVKVGDCLGLILQDITDMRKAGAGSLRLIKKIHDSVEEIRKKYEITTDKIVGMVAGFYPRKDYALFLEVAQHIVSHRDDVTFIAVGHGDMLYELKKSVPSSLSNRIKFLGVQKEVEEIVNLFTVGVLASNAHLHGEGISNAIMEYMALGKPVVATKCGGNCEIIQEGKTGFLVNNGSVVDMCNRVTQLLDNVDLAVRFGEEGQLRLRQEFNLEKMTEKYYDLYRGLMANVGD